MNNDMTTIKLDKERPLKFRRKELKLIEESFNKTISKIDFDNMGIDDITKMIWLGLQHEDPGITLEKTEELMDISDMTFGDMTKAVMTAFAVSMGGVVENNTEEKN